MKNEQFIQNLIEDIAWTRNLYQAHVSYYDQLLPHILMEEISEVFLKISDEVFVLRVNREENLSKLTNFLVAIENGINTGSDEVSNLIVLSFLENISPRVRSFSYIKQLMGESLKSELKNLISYQYGENNNTQD